MFSEIMISELGLPKESVEITLKSFLLWLN